MRCGICDETVVAGQLKAHRAACNRATLAPTTITLEPPAPFINLNDRLHHMVKAKLTKAWREAARDAILDSFTPYHYTRARIVVAYRFPTNRRRECSNLQPTSKAIVDGLVDANLLPDDSDAHVVGPDNRRHIPNGSPLVTVTITPLEENAHDRAV